MTDLKETRQRHFPSTVSTTSLVKLYILHLLKEKDYYGNKIKDEITSRLHNKWSPSPGMIYPLLRQLESQGYIIGRWEEPNKRSIRRYKITDSGLKHYKVILLQHKPAFMDSLFITKTILQDIYNEKV